MWHYATRQEKEQKGQQKDLLSTLVPHTNHFVVIMSSSWVRYNITSATFSTISPHVTLPCTRWALQPHANIAARNCAHICLLVPLPCFPSRVHVPSALELKISGENSGETLSGLAWVSARAVDCLSFVLLTFCFCLFAFVVRVVSRISGADYFLYIYIYIYIYTYIYIYIYIYAYTCMHRCVGFRVGASMWVCVCLCSCLCPYQCPHVTLCHPCPAHFWIRQ